MGNEERKAARAYLAHERGNRPQGGPGGPGGRRGGFGGPREDEAPVQHGTKLTPGDVQSFPKAATYDPSVLRTFFLEFENSDWEKELADFNNTDVEVPAQLTVDGRVYRDVGVHFRGQSSYMMVGEGRKRSLNLSLDWVHDDQQLGGYRTFNLLNAHGDPTFLRAVIYLHVAREYIPAPQANLVRVVINGENWGVYPSVQQFNKDWVKDWFDTTKGARWKVPGSPGGRGGLEYIGEDVSAYKRLYEIKTKDNPESWASLIQLCRVLNQTSPDQLEQALAPLLDIDGALRFLALENVLINNDGYWIRASDYNLYQDINGRFHVIPYDVNEVFNSAGGPGFGGGPGQRGPRGGPAPDVGAAPEAGPDFRPGNVPGSDPRSGAPRAGGIELDPLIAAQDASKPLLSRLLAVPELRARYLGYVRDIAETWLDWNRLGPVVDQYRSLIATDVEADTRKLYPTAAFQNGITGDTAESAGAGFGPGGPTMNLKSFADKRRDYLLERLSTQ